MMPDRKTSTPRARGVWRDISEQLQNEIYTGRLEPREHLIEDEIMERTGASRHAVRRAFDDLVSLGLASSTPNRGTRVRGYSLEEVKNLYEIRETLEQGAAARIPLPAPQELIDELKRIEAIHKAANDRRDMTGVFEANNRFHETLYAACGNPILAEAIASYARQTLPIRMRFTAYRGFVPDAGREHDQMIDLLSGTDNEALAALCYRHLQPSKEFYASIAVPQPVGPTKVSQHVAATGDSQGAL